MQVSMRSLRAAPVASRARSAVAVAPVCVVRKAASVARKQQARLAAPCQQQQRNRGQQQVCLAAATADKLISSTEVPAFIPRDDLMDQMFSWSKVEGAESGQRNFGMPMSVTPQYRQINSNEMLWGFTVGIFREGNKICDLSVSYDKDSTFKHEWIGMGEDGFPTKEGRSTEVIGKNFEIWKLGDTPVDEDLRRTIRAYCTALAQALNRYYAFGSVFVDDAQ